MPEVKKVPMSAAVAASLGALVSSAPPDGALDLAVAWIESKFAHDYPKSQWAFERGLAHANQEAEAAAKQRIGLPISTPLMPDVTDKVRLPQ